MPNSTTLEGLNSIYNSFHKELIEGSLEKVLNVPNINNTYTIDPNVANIFAVDALYDATIAISSPNNLYPTTGSVITILLIKKDPDTIVVWPNNIKWYKNITPTLYRKNLITFQYFGDNTWYGSTVITDMTCLSLDSWAEDNYGYDFDEGYLYCSKMTTIPQEDLEYLYLNISKSYTIERLLASCYALSYIDVSEWNVENVVNMSSAFEYCSALTSLNVSNWNTSSIKNMYSLFERCSSLQSLDLSKWDTSKVYRMIRMFYGCTSLTTLDISNFDSSSIESMSYMFQNCTNLQYLIIGSNTFKFQMKDSNCGYLNNTCKILVPSTLLNTYKTSTNWSSKSSQFDAIENYTITRSNGQVTVTPNS